MSADEPTYQVARFWTGARRFPKLIGKSMSGDRIPGGPYTIAQAAGGAGTAWLLWETQWLWAPDSVITILAVIAGLTWGAVWLLGKIPIQTRNPIVWVAGVVQAIAAPGQGRFSGERISRSAFGPARVTWAPVVRAPVWRGPLPGAVVEAAEEASESVPSVPAPTEEVVPTAAPTARLVTDVATEPSATWEPVPDTPALTGLQRLLADAARIESPPADADRELTRIGER